MEKNKKRVDRYEPAPNCDLTAKEVMTLLNISRRTFMIMLNDPIRNIRWYRTGNHGNKYGRPRVPRSELEKFRMNNLQILGGDQ